MDKSLIVVKQQRRFVGQQRRFVSHRSSRERFEAVRRAGFFRRKKMTADGSR